jgi:hypothetical protein
MFDRKASVGLLAVSLMLSLSAAVKAQGPGLMMSQPNMSNTLGLLMRPEVQNEIRLDLRQRNALAQVQDNARNRAMQRIRDQFQQMRNLSPEERRQRMQNMRNEMMTQMQQFQGEINEQLKQLLRENQLERLHQLDLQWRGPMAMADPKVAEEIKLSQKSRAEINKIFSEYQRSVGEVFRGAFEQWQQQGGPRGGAPMPDFQSRLSPLRQKVDELKKSSEQQVLELLTPEERSRWNAALGEPFRFRQDQPRLNQRRRGN